MPPRTRRTTTTTDLDAIFQTVANSRMEPPLVYTGRDGNPNMVESSIRRQEKTNLLALKVLAQESFNGAKVTDELATTTSPEFINLLQAFDRANSERRFR